MRKKTLLIGMLFLVPFLCMSMYTHSNTSKNKDHISKLENNSFELINDDCNPTLLAHWNLDACESFPNTNSPNDFSEFTANISPPSGFNSISASILDHYNGSHSCSYGQSFVWVDGSTASYTNWRSGEPNNSSDTGEDYARMLDSDGRWTDRDEDYRRHFVMEIPCNSVTGQNFVSASGEIFDFRAVKNGRVVRTYWATNSESINDYFILERSYDGVNFDLILNINSITDNRGAFNYFEFNSDPYLGDNFYRLAKVHYNGTIKYSPVRKVTFDIDLSKIAIFPNPATNEIYIDLEEFEGRSATISIFNQFGQRMDIRMVEEVDTNPLRFDLTKYTDGTYIMYINMEGTKNFAKKFIISRLQSLSLIHI